MKESEIIDLVRNEINYARVNGGVFTRTNLFKKYNFNPKELHLALCTLRDNKEIESFDALEDNIKVC